MDHKYDNTKTLPEIIDSIRDRSIVDLVNALEEIDRRLLVLEPCKSPAVPRRSEPHDWDHRSGDVVRCRRCKVPK